jgi:hypothetical protein
MGSLKVEILMVGLGVKKIKEKLWRSKAFALLVSCCGCVFLTIWAFSLGFLELGFACRMVFYLFIYFYETQFLCFFFFFNEIMMWVVLTF